MTKCESLNSRFRHRAHAMFISNIVDNSDDESEREMEDIGMNESDEDSDFSSLAHSVSMTTSDSSSDDENLDHNEKKLENVSQSIVDKETNFQCEKSICDEACLVLQATTSSTNETFRTDQQTTATSQASTSGQDASKGVYFKKINRTNKSYILRSNYRKVYNNKRQRKT